MCGFDFSALLVVHAVSGAHLPCMCPHAVTLSGASMARPWMQTVGTMQERRRLPSSGRLYAGGCARERWLLYFAAVPRRDLHLHGRLIRKYPYGGFRARSDQSATSGAFPSAVHISPRGWKVG